MMMGSVQNDPFEGLVRDLKMTFWGIIHQPTANEKSFTKSPSPVSTLPTTSYLPMNLINGNGQLKQTQIHNFQLQLQSPNFPPTPSQSSEKVGDESRLDGIKQKRKNSKQNSEKKGSREEENGGELKLKLDEKMAGEQAVGSALVKVKSEIIVQPLEPKRRTRPRRFTYIGSKLRIEIPQGHDSLFLQLCSQPSHGYSEGNAQQAMARFSRRKLFTIDRTKFVETGPQSSNWGNSLHICFKFISVPAIPDAVHVRFEGRGIDKEAAETECDLKIVVELYEFDVIKEASVELYSRRRKDLLDPTRKMDPKLLAWLNSGAETMARKMDEIVAREDVFY